MALALASLAAALPPARVLAQPVATEVTVLGLQGYDPVTYFLPEGPRAGAPQFEASWDGRVWRFANEANRAVFRRDPGVYAPRLGGFDAAGILDRRLVDANPIVFAIIGQRLYLFRDDDRRARFLAQPALAASAEAIWPRLRGLLDDPPPVDRPNEAPSKPGGPAGDRQGK
ncbi:MAG: hypothetical protein INR63_07140 [Actinomycetospora chiangmaiensis]|nr:hypothetical protein [Actinomycetospora chiangmaiensis]